MILPVASPPISALRAPFPWFGGKRRVAHLVWPRFGNVSNYVEPFAGSLAVLLARPEEWVPRNETVNDLDCYLANFWRAVSRAPEDVAAAADWPVNEADLHARHRWLHDQAAFRERMHSDPEYFDAKIAGWWVWGISCWIGDNWCRTEDGPGPDSRRQALAAGGLGVHSALGKRPMIKKGNVGVQSFRGRGQGHECMKRPDLRKGARGVGRLSNQCPHIGGANSTWGMGVHASFASNLHGYMASIGDRLRRVRVCCGNWNRILGPSPTIHIGVTAVFLDPPYGAEDRDKVYNHDSLELAAEVQVWCAEHGEDRRLRIALCGYEGEHNALEALGWDKLAWKASGGYGARNKLKDNGSRERIWFSPGCLRPDKEESLWPE